MKPDFEPSCCAYSKEDYVQFRTVASFDLTTKPQRGFIFGIYGYLAIGLVVVALFAWGKVQSARLDAAQQKVVALEQQVSQWRNVAGECSKATEKAKTEADNRAAAALAALGRVKAESAKGKAEAERLRGLVGQKPVTECPAGEGVQQVRKGLVSKTP